jgi:uncharacterized protein (DUF885 family)
MSFWALILLVFWVVNLIWYKPFSVDLFYERTFIEYGMDDPELMSRLELDKIYGITTFNDRLTDISDEHRSKAYESISERNLVMLHSYKVSEQSESQLLSSSVLDWYLENEVLKFHAADQSYLVNHVDGIQISLPHFMVEVHKITHLGDAEDYLSRLSAFPTKFDQLIDLLNKRESAGIIAPKFIIERVTHEIKSFLSKDVENNPLYKDFVFKIRNSQHIREIAFEELESDAKIIIKHEVYPSYENLLSFLEDQYERANNISGAWKLPKGQLYYLAARKTHTTLEKSSEEMHDLGILEVDKVQKKLRVVFDSLGLSQEKSISELLREVAQDSSFYYLDSANAEEDLLADFQTMVNGIKYFLPELYLKYPQNKIVVKKLPAFREETTSLISYQAPKENEDVAIIYLNLKNISRFPKYKLQTMVFHEVLGNFVQYWHENELEHVPTFRKGLRFKVFTEGWALYCERLAREQEYFNSYHELVGNLQMELYTAALLVVDTGIHYDRWNRKKAAKYLYETTGLSDEEILDEIDRIIVKAGEACLYKIGELEFLKLRKKVEKELGKKYNLKDFHDLILKNGNMPLTVLRTQVDKEIERIKNPKKKEGIFD